MVPPNFELTIICERAIKPPDLSEYPSLTKKLVSWAAFNDSEDMPQDLYLERKEFTTSRSGYCGRIGLLSRTGNRTSPSRLLKSILRYIRLNPGRIRHTALSLFLTKIPQFFVLNFFNSLGHSSILQGNDEWEIHVEKGGERGMIPASEMISKGLDLMGIGLYHDKLDYISRLVEWSVSLELLERRNRIYVPTDTAFGIMLNRRNHFPHALDTKRRSLTDLQHELMRFAVSTIRK